MNGINKLSAAQALIESLLAENVDTIFGIISSHTMEIFDVLYDQQDNIQFISARHEHAAAMMADGYARVTGRPGICLTSTGPGAANSMGGLGEAYFASSPVLNITSTSEQTLFERGLGPIHETKDQRGMLSSVTQNAYHVNTPQDIPKLIHNAFTRFGTVRPRPISIQIPVDLQGKINDFNTPDPVPAPLQKANDNSVKKAAALILKSKRMGILAGTGIHRSGASQELTNLVEKLGVPVFTTANGKGSIAEDHPLSLGMYGGEYEFPPGNLVDPRQTFANSLDTLLVVGSSLSWFRAKSQGLKQPPNLIHMDIDPQSIGNWYETTVSLIGDARTILSQLSASIAEQSSQMEMGFSNEIRRYKTEIKLYKRQSMPKETAIMETIRTVTERDAIFVGDVSICNHRGSNYCLETYVERSYLTPAWGGLGFGLPAAMGAKAATPHRQVVCISGDGGFQFNIQELGTCLQYGLNPVVILFNDNAWGLLRQYQKAKGDRYIASNLLNPDFVKVAEAYGAYGISVSNLEELGPALEKALNNNTMTIVEVLTPDGFANFV